MEYVGLGASGLKVSRIALGCMSFGDPTRSLHGWVLDEDAAQPLFRKAVELGITLWDTANTYGAGSSEEIVGRAIRRYSRRDDLVLATKVFGRMHDGPGGSGLSRKAIFEQVDASLSRLGTDYIDLYQTHAFDEATPVAETMEALHDLVKAGKVRYIGASNMHAWRFAKMQQAASDNNLTRFESMQDQYSLMQREEEREMFGLLDDQGVACLPWSPLARGLLTRPWGTRTARTRTDKLGMSMFDDSGEPIVQAVQRVAEQRDVAMASVALAWVLHNPVVSAPIVGATRERHLQDAVDALDLRLTTNEVGVLESAYDAHPPAFATGLHTEK